jgi:SOS-response transcriptional repressor LexA
MLMAHEVPILSPAEALQPEAVDNFMPARHAEMVAITVEKRRHTFAIRVRGDSMAASEHDSFPEGAMLVVEPDMTPIPGDYVIASDLCGEVLFQQLVADNDGFLLKPLNSRYPTRPLGEHRLIGVVRETMKSFR